MTTLAEWTNEVLLGVITGIPLQDNAYVESLIDAYVLDVGGWIPDNINDPTGSGEISGGATVEEVVAEIIQDEYDSIYETEMRFAVNLEFTTLVHLTPDLTEEDVQAAIEGQMKDVVGDHLFATKLFTPTQIDLDQLEMKTGGLFDSVRRLDIQDEILSPTEPPQSLSAIALKAARSVYGLGDEWSVYSVYTRPGKAASVLVKSYADDAYVHLDTQVTFFYVINVDPISKRIISGVKINLG